MDQQHEKYFFNSFECKQIKPVYEVFPARRNNYAFGRDWINYPLENIWVIWVENKIINFNLKTKFVFLFKRRCGD